MPTPVFPKKKYFLTTTFLDKLKHTWLIMVDAERVRHYPIGIVDFLTLGCLIPFFFLYLRIRKLGEEAQKTLIKSICYTSALFFLILYTLLKSLLSSILTIIAMPCIVIVHLVSLWIAAPSLKITQLHEPLDKITDQTEAMPITKPSEKQLASEKEAIQALKKFINETYPEILTIPGYSFELEVNNVVGPAIKISVALIGFTETGCVVHAKHEYLFPAVTRERLQAKDGLFATLRAYQTLGIITQGDALERLQTELHTIISAQETMTKKQPDGIPLIPADVADMVINFLPPFSLVPSSNKADEDSSRRLGMTVH